jgi:hypothetical protein
LAAAQQVDEDFEARVTVLGSHVERLEQRVK